MRRALLCTFFLLANVAFAADDHPTFTLWPEGKTPGAVGSGQGHEPTLTVWLPADGKGNGAAMVVAPGGGYAGLAMDHEGVQIAQWLNDNGIAAFILQYRHAPSYAHPYPWMDASRALRTMKASRGSRVPSFASASTASSTVMCISRTASAMVNGLS
mgnify:CR=1 FL=1